MSVQEHTSSAAATTTTGERSVYQSLFDKINLAPVSSLKMSMRGRVMKRFPMRLRLNV